MQIILEGVRRMLDCRVCILRDDPSQKLNITSLLCLKRLREDRNSAGRVQIKVSCFAVTPEAPPRRPLPYRLHEDYAPSWDFVGGGARMILTCSANETNFEVPMDAALHVSFDSKEVCDQKREIRKLLPCNCVVRQQGVNDHREEES